MSTCAIHMHPSQEQRLLLVILRCLPTAKYEQAVHKNSNKWAIPLPLGLSLSLSPSLSLSLSLSPEADLG